jgi:hypothetical protein
MRLLLVSAIVIATALVRPADAQNAPPDPGSATPSLLGPIMPQALPPPTPLPPAATEQQAVPSGLPPARAAAPASPASDPGTIVAVPLPPPGVGSVPTPTFPAADAPNPQNTSPSGGATSASGVPIPLTPIPLTPIPLALPSVAASAGAPKPGLPPAKSATAPIVSAKLATPELSPEASPGDFLRAARGALVTGRNGEARSALEMAQTRLLDRSVDAGTENVPSHNLAVKQISEAISALASNDRMACLRYIEFASQTIGSPLD